MLTVTAGLLAATLAVRRGPGCRRGPRGPRGPPRRRPGSWATRRRRGAWSVARRCARSCCATPRPGPACWPGCSSAAPGWCGSTRCARWCCCCRWWPWGRRSGRAGPGRCWLGLGVSLLVSAVAAVGLSWQYLASIAGSLVPLVALGVLVGGGSWVALVLWRRGRRLPAVVHAVAARPRASPGVVVVGLYLAEPAAVAGRAAGAPTTPGRATWPGCRRGRGCRSTAGAPTPSRPWRGCPGTSGRSRWRWRWSCWPCCVRRAVLSAQSRRVDAWLPALLVASGSTLLTLARPGITPDHPWADRRLLIALPLVVALVVTGLAWVVRRTAAAGRAWLGVPSVAGRGRCPRRGARGAGDLAAPGRWCRAGVAGRRRRRCATPWRPVTSCWPSTRAPPTSGPRWCAGCAGCRPLATTSALRADPDQLAATVATVSQEVAARGGRLVLLAADSATALDRLGRHGDRGRRHDRARGRARPGAEAVAHRPAAGPRLARPAP